MKQFIDQGLTALSLIPKKSLAFSEMDPRLQDFLIAAAGLSKKSLNHLPKATIKKIIEDILPLDRIQNVDTKNDLLYRFLLTSGDSLGGSMRNIVGDLGQDRLVGVLEAQLLSRSIDYTSANSSSGKVSLITWEKQSIYFNKKPRFIDKSIDVIVLKKDGDLENPDSYLACGELKSGIDPAGADEHWKTAKSALGRIRDNFVENNRKPPYLFFIGAAIETSMANEAVQMMSQGTLNLASNLYKDKQINRLITELLDLA
jgi:type II restriction enzyme